MIWSDCEDAEAPESSKPIGPQQWPRGKFGESLGEKEEGHCTPVFGAKLLHHLQQNAAYSTITDRHF